MLQIRLPYLTEPQAQIRREMRRFNVVDAGRRFGKTRFGVLWALEGALAGEYCWWVSPSYKMSEVGWRLLKFLSGQIPGARIKEADRIVEYPGGGWLRIRSADEPDSLRGEGLHRLVIDEAALLKFEAWAYVLRPTLTDTRGSALFISSPRGRNWFYDLWLLGQKDSVTHDPDWASWRFPTSSNPFIDPREIEAARRLLPEAAFAQEYEALFTDEAGAVFKGVLSAATARVQDRAIPGHAYVFGADWGRLNDFTVVAVLDITLKHVVYLDRFTQIDFHAQAGRLLDLAGRFRPAVIVAEQNAFGLPVCEDLSRQGLPIRPFVTTNASKSAIIQGVELGLAHGELKFIPDAQLLRELQVFALARTSTGLYKYGAPSGEHDDCVMALALAWSAVPDSGPLICGDTSWLDAELDMIMALERELEALHA